MKRTDAVSKAGSRAEKELLHRLSAGLSEEEIQRVFAGALSTLGTAGIGSLVAKLGPDTGAALRRALQSSPKSTPPRPGPAKVLQEWNGAWKDWDGVIAEACDEEGNYVIQEHHWEEPYFDPLSLTSDLEPIAERMAALLPRVFDEDLDPDFGFAEAVAEGVEEIKTSLPEWLSPFDNEGFCLGPKATGCLVEWELLGCRSEGRSMFHLFDKLRALEESTRGLWLDEKTLASFVRGIDKDGKNDLLDGIRAHRNEDRWSKVLNSAHTGWFLIYKDLCRGQDRSGYLETCRAKISQDWSLAIPVIKELARKKANEELCRVCADAATSFLRVRGEKEWDPRDTLIASRGGGRYGEKPDARFILLLTAWQHAAAALGHKDTAEAIRLQSALLAHWRNWDKALAAFRRVSSPDLDPMRDKLFDQWRSLVTQRSADRFDFDRDPSGLWEEPRVEKSWVRALIDAAWKGEVEFQEGLRLWLKGMEADRRSKHRGLNELARLSLDVESGSWLKTFAPTLARILGHGWPMDNALLASRRKWLSTLGAADLIPDLQAFWKRNILSLVPDPASNAGSDYERCVDWLLALREIDPEAANQLLGEWGAVHWRRRSLWNMVRRKGLPVPVRHGRIL